MFLVLLIFLFTVLYVYFKLNNQYWKKRNIEGPEPTIFVGNIGEQFLGKKHIGVIFREIYNKYQHLPYVGIYRATTPCLLIRDPELVKDIYITNFKHFGKNDVHIDRKIDPIMGRNPFVLVGEEWKKQRHVLAPCFTTGKMKSMFPLIDHTGNAMIEFIKNHISEPLETKELSAKFTIDNVASCAFGAEGRCFIEPMSDFRELAVNFLTPGSIQAAKLALTFVVPDLAKIMSMKFVKADVEDKLREIVKATVEYREKSKIERQDFLHFMNQLRLQSKGDFTYEDMTAQSAAFFIDGYETSSSVMSFLLYELASNRDKQTFLREELMTTLSKNNNNLTYDLISEMPYLDACLVENLRKNILVESIGKICTETYTYTPSEKSGYKTKPITIEAGTTVIIPTGGLSRDPNYYKNPDQFIPERWLEKNDANDGKLTFRPFGDGPRACLGQKFAQMQIKAGICHIIKNFSLSVNNKTQLPLKADPWHFANVPIGGLWINFESL